MRANELDPDPNLIAIKADDLSRSNENLNNGVRIGVDSPSLIRYREKIAFSLG
jgi:hypothetical protein